MEFLYWEYSFTVTVNKADQTAPAPTAASVTVNSVTLNTVTGCEYSKDGTNWQDSPIFNGLTMKIAVKTSLKNVGDNMDGETHVWSIPLYAFFQIKEYLFLKWGGNKQNILSIRAESIEVSFAWHRLFA